MATVAGMCGLSEQVTLAVLPRLFYEELLIELNRRGMNMDRSTFNRGELLSLLQDLMVEEYFALQTSVGEPSLQNNGPSSSGVQGSEDGAGYPGTESEPGNIPSVPRIKQEVEEPFPVYAACVGADRADTHTPVTATETQEHFEDTTEGPLHLTDEINVTIENEKEDDDDDDDEIYDHFGCTDEAFKTQHENCYQDIIDENDTSYRKGVRQCPHCDYTSVHSTTMKRHMFRHTGEKPFACSLCNYTTSRKYCLVNHMDMQHVRSWQKDSAQKGGNASGGLASCKKMSGKKKAKQKCYFCSYTSSTKKSMTKHLAQKHARQHSLQERNYQHNASLNNSAASSNGTLLETAESFDKTSCVEYGETSPVVTNEMIQPSELNSDHNSAASNSGNAKQVIISCPLCKYTSKLVKQMEQHIRSHTVKGPFKCPECSFLATERSELFLHIETHERFSCHDCGYRAATRGGLTRHRARQHPVKLLLKGDDCSSLDESIQLGEASDNEKVSLECRRCSYCTTDRSHFQEHIIKVHGKAGRFTCEVCGFWAASHSRLQKHMKKLHLYKGSGTARPQEVALVVDGSPLQVRLVSCTYDQSSVDKRGRDTNSKDMTLPNDEVTAHNQTTEHIGTSEQAVSVKTAGVTAENEEEVRHKAKPYMCGECGYRAATKHTLSAHMRKHLGGKVFECQQCGLQASSHSDLVIHVRKHTGEKPYKCPHCTTAFARKQNLRRHIKVHERIRKSLKT
ncbi:PREDICTED: zinc finger protein 2 homolog isoform X2 [Branchiostoma belcheri]|nr:PREDICTED: zinc finger protein 2 homolog isoform X2 [Branchiostoma belcheri]